MKERKGNSYGILCSDFKTSGLAAEEKESREKEKEKEKDKKGKGKENGNGEKEKKTTKKKKPAGLFAIDWFRIGASLLVSNRSETELIQF